MGQPVVHFEVIGKDPEALQSFYSDLCGWEIDSDNPMNYGVVQREGNVNDDGVGIGGGVGAGPEGYDGHVTFYIEVPDVEAALAKAESLGGSRMMGPDKVMERVEIGLFNDPEGHPVGFVKAVSQS
jgi:predicted enzyme related to lactoylglutathione lyase